MNKKLKLAAVLGLTVLSLWGCQMKKEETVNVVTEQPVLGVDVSGYEGFSHLSAYTLEGETPCVLYLPADDYAYVGGSCIISKKEGVETTLNLNPLFSEEVSDKSLKQKLKYILDSEYSVTYRKNYSDLDISDVATAENGAAKAEVSYLVYDDEAKGYVGQWLEYYLVELEDGRLFKVVIRVDSDSETGQAGEVVEELEKYFETDFAYEGGNLQAKIDGYNPSEDELARMTGNTIPFGDFYVYLPEGWDKNTVYSNLVPEATVYGANGNSVDQSRLIYMLTQDAVGSSAQLGSLSKGEQQIFSDMFEEQLSKQYGVPDVEINMMGMTDMGFVFTAYIEDYEQEGIEIYVYYICRGNTIYGIGGLSMESGDDEGELIELVDRVYSSMEVR